MIHQSVLLKESLDFLNPKPNENFIDATFGAAGHSLAILEKTKPKGRVLAIDWWEESIKHGKSLKEQKPEVKERLFLVEGNFAQIKEFVEKFEFKPVNGILFDLGLSSDILQASGRGFSYQKDEILDMRYNQKQISILARDILNKAKEKELENIFKNFGEERFSRKIAKTIVQIRKKEKFLTTKQLVRAIEIALYKKPDQKKIHPKILARIFQSLRIAVNKELENLEKALDSSLEILAKKGRIVVISYHSLEDRIVKNKFREASKLGLGRILTKKPIQPTEEEVKINPRARSAKLRAIEKI